MKRLWLLSFLFIFLLATPIVDQQPVLFHSASPDEIAEFSADRVDGEDLSSIIHGLVSQNSVRNLVMKLTENGSREISSPTIYSAANAYSRSWMISKLDEFSDGRIETEVIGNHMSVVGRLPGYLGFGPVMMIGGHYDSVNGAPGANDDGIGVAAALELARVMSMFDWPLDIYFGFWNAEEIGLIGAGEVAEEFKNRGIDILMYYNVDMLLVVDPTAPLDERVLLAYNNDDGNYAIGQYWAELAKMMSKNVGYDMIKPVPDSSFGGWSRSDHYAFLGEGYERVMFAHESGFAYDGAYHQPSDTWDNPNYDYTVATELVAAVGASMAFTMARAYGQKTNLYYSGSISLGFTTEYYFAISLATEFTISGIWNQDAEFSLYLPDGVLKEASTVDGTFHGEDTILDVNLLTKGLYKLVIDNQGIDRLDYSIDIEYDTDVDGDTRPDSLGFWLDQGLFEVDSDADGLSDAVEMILGTNIWDSDSDDDTMTDGWEYDHELDPLVDDSELDLDEDGLTNLNEFLLLTNPNNVDTEGDLCPDGWEVDYDLDPLYDDAMEDPDLDDLVNLHEYGNGTSPQNPDSDSDSMPDGFEIENGLNPLVNDATSDGDGDGVSNLDEFLRGTDPSQYDIPVMTVVLGGAGVAIVIGGVLFYYKRHWVHLGGA
ncbi:MAG: M28 family peptidase [Candidatus Thorarchaeota archaeon]